MKDESGWFTKKYVLTLTIIGVASAFAAPGLWSASAILDGGQWLTSVGLAGGIYSGMNGLEKVALILKKT